LFDSVDFLVSVLQEMAPKKTDMINVVLIMGAKKLGFIKKLFISNTD
jgi:hypothetical protein